jgi:hypothetical protein
MIQGKDVGDALVESALAPIQKASTRLQDGAIAEGIAGFGKAELMAGLRTGIENAASRVGFPTKEVEQLLAWDTLLPALEKLDAAQVAATNAFREQAVSVGGLLTGGLSRNTNVDVYRQSGALALGNIARRFVRDKELCEPLEALAAEVGAWEALIAKCGDILEASPLVARSLQRRRLFRIAALAVVLVAASGGGFVWWSKKKVSDAQARVNAIIADADPCKVETIASEDAAHATPDQVRRRDERLKACAAARAIAAREAACETLAKNFEAGKLTPEDLAEAKDAASLLTRAAKLELATDDLLVTRKAMPCQDTPAKDRFFTTYAIAAAGTGSAWTTATQVSADLREALKSKQLAGTTAWRDELSSRGEPLAAKAILSGKPEDMERAKSSCDFQTSFGLEPGKKCSGLLSIMSRSK